MVNMIRCPHCHHLVSPNNRFCPFCGTSLQNITNLTNQSNNPNNSNNTPNFNSQPIPPRQYPHKKHHYIIGTLAVIILLAIGAGGAYMLTGNNSSTQQQSSEQSPSRNSNQSNNSSSKPSSSNNSNSSTTSKPKAPSHTTKQSTPANKPGYTLSVLPNKLQGTWYSYDEGKLNTLTITSNKIISNGDTETIHARPKNADAMKAANHPTWGVAMIFPKLARGIRLLNVRGWNQTAGDGDDYGIINTNGMTVLDLAGGAGAETDANFFKSKQQAKQNKKKQYKGEKREDLDP